MQIWSMRSTTTSEKNTVGTRDGDSSRVMSIVQSSLNGGETCECGRYYERRCELFEHRKTCKVHQQRTEQ